jgi:aryl-alcohol dehydrogenase-like predicted oxidoreductase
MQPVTISGTDLTISRLSFGTSRLHRLASTTDRQRVLAAAADHGFTHFDTAPLYGYGLAEEELGRFLQRRNQGLTVATKIGLYPPPGARPTTSSVWTRKMLGKVLRQCNSPRVDWSVDAAVTSLDGSLRRLGADHIDLLLLHEPEAEAFDPDPVLHWLEKERARGRVRAWGVAGEAMRMGTRLIRHRLAAVLQVRDSLEDKQADAVIAAGRHPQITFGYLSAARLLTERPSPVSVLTAAMRRNTAGSILVSSLNPSRVAQLGVIAA